MLAYAGPQRRLRLGLVAAALALLLFASWEGFITHTYGESHFLHGFHERSEPLWRRIRFLVPLVGILGGGVAALLVLNVVALGSGGRRVLGTAALVVAGYLLIALVPERYAVLIGNARTDKVYLTLNTLLFGAVGLVLAGTMLALLWQLVSGRAGSVRRREYFLAVWLVWKCSATLA
jgi:hypothetical protein